MTEVFRSFQLSLAIHADHTAEEEIQLLQVVENLRALLFGRRKDLQIHHRNSALVRSHDTVARQEQLRLETAAVEGSRRVGKVHVAVVLAAQNQKPLEKTRGDVTIGDTRRHHIDGCRKGPGVE